MKRLKRVLKYVSFILLIPIIYLLIALLLSSISVNKQQKSHQVNQSIYLSTNGVHVDIVLPKTLIEQALLANLKRDGWEKYYAFGWGDRAFYLETPTWEDLTLRNTLRAAFLKSPTLMHVTRYQQVQSKWVKVPISEAQLQDLNHFIAASFHLDAQGQKRLLTDSGYHDYDDFYEANGSYSVLYNCNSWANDALKSSDLKASAWTIFDFGILNKYAD